MSVSFSRWFAVRGSGMDEASARAAWDAAINQAYDVALDRAFEQRRQIHGDDDLDAEAAAVKFLEARRVASLVYELRSAA